MVPFGNPIARAVIDISEAMPYTLTVVKSLFDGLVDNDVVMFTKVVTRELVNNIDAETIMASSIGIARSEEIMENVYSLMGLDSEMVFFSDIAHYSLSMMHYLIARALIVTLPEEVLGKARVYLLEFFISETTVTIAVY
jgi:hypothetical protein